MLFKLSTLPTRVDGLAWYPYSDALQQAATFVTRFKDQVEYGVRAGSMLGLPWSMAPGFIPPHLDHRVLRHVGELIPKKPPRDEEQRKMIAASYRLLAAGVGHIAEASTGFGKTYIGLAIACLLGQRTLIVVPKSDLAEQWEETARDLIGLPSSEVGVVKADKVKVDGKRVVIGSLQSLAIPDRYPSSVYEAFGFVMFDEVHRMGAETFLPVCGKFPARLRLGLSAKSKRSDNKEQLFSAHLGDVMVKGGYLPAIPRVVMQRTGTRFPEWMKHMQPGRIMQAVKYLEGCHARNNLAVGFALAGGQKGRRVVFMSETISHLDVIRALLIQNGVSGEEIGDYTGNTKGILRKSEAAKRYILATFRFAQEGTNFPDWDTLVLLHPKVDPEQSVGRVCRAKEGKDTPVVLDLVDSHPLLNTFAMRRRDYYVKVGAQIIERNP